MWDSRGGLRGFKWWPLSLGHVMWHFVPHIRYGILEVAPVPFHMALSFTYQSSNRSIMYQNSVVIPCKAIIMIQVLYSVRSYGIKFDNSVM